MNESEILKLWSASLESLGGVDGDPGATYGQGSAGLIAPTIADSAPGRGSFSSTAAGTMAAPLSSMGARSRPTETALAGAVSVGEGFEFLDELGRGGMGVVYRARQLSLRRQVAVKKANAGRDPRRFVMEAEVTGGLDHPNIVPVHDLRAGPEGEPQLAMKLIDGTEWSALIHGQGGERRDLEEHLEVLLKVCDAVAFAHSRAIIHCDLKPENVMVGGFGEVLVMDWGLAMDAGPAPSQEPGRPRHRTVVTDPCGTPSYMAPELAEGRGADVGPWTDVYLLGAILYELITGRAPHGGSTLVKVILSACQSRPPVFEAGVPEELAEICRRAMARHPRQRFASVVELQAALRGFLRHRESARVEADARAGLERCQQALEAAGGPLDRAGRIRLYADFAEALAGFHQAAKLWQENPRARSGEQAARLGFARAALLHRDLGLAEAHLSALDKGSPDKKALRQELRAQAERIGRARRRNRLVYYSLIGAVALILVGLVVGAVVMDAARRRADEQAAEARRARAAAEESALRARDSQAVAERRLAEVNRLADVKVAGDLRGQIEDDWPALARSPSELDRWLAEAREVLGRRALHEDTWRALRLKGIDGRFDDARLQWKHDVLAELLKNLDSLSSEHLPRAEARRSAVAEVVARSLTAPAEDWRRAIAAIESSPRYPNLKGVMRPQLGLVPIGADPKSGLWEFAHVESGERPARSADGRLDLSGASAMVFVLVPGGTCWMGSTDGDPDERPRHRVEIRAFFLSKFELTQGQWRRLTGESPSRFSGDLRPVEQVDWDTARRVAPPLGLRLPSESEWEYACRAGSQTRYFWGAEMDPRYCWFDKSSGGGTRPVSEHIDRANAFGLVDMLGNVWEYCEDDYIGDYQSGPADHRPRVGNPRSTGRVGRGGSWNNNAANISCSFRAGGSIADRKDFVGVRLARDLDRR